MTYTRGKSRSPEKKDEPTVKPTPKARKNIVEGDQEDRNSPGDSVTAKELPAPERTPAATGKRGRSLSPDKVDRPKKANTTSHISKTDREDDEEYKVEDSARFAKVKGFPRLQRSKPFPPPLDFLSTSPWVLPTKNNRIVNLDPNTVARDALETVVVMHPRLPSLVTAFLAYKRAHGSILERDLYETMSQHGLVARLVKQRPLHFVQHADYTVLRNGTSGTLRVEWLRVGTSEEHKNVHIFLKDDLSYDEMMLSSLLGTSGPTFFINTGHRTNSAKIDAKTLHQDRGIIVGLVGARFAQPGHMDAACILPPIKTHKSGYFFRKQDAGLTKLFQEFFGGRPDGSEFNVPVYKGRMRISIETLLLEADDRAAQAGTTAYVQLVGLGLGVWRHSPVEEEQKVWYVEELTACLSRLDLRHVSTLEVAWVDVPKKTRLECFKAGSKAGIAVLFNKRDRCAKLDSEELLVVSWAWDSNSLPGNEYWSGFTDDSDDPAAVCCSTIAELHNPYVNPFEHRIKVLQERGRS
ncbi:hypothetical protein LTR36_007769 [Oleoguttula mirabilis]|uniref:Uncharacterized protein n=1 Tax=Oleoguttula mirabilis TaxID=1507867 RepID=A0AAV9J9G2_9PEZI|nr:hypothetical protein LTR36_007769 [Oleoguttula mirabilis]